MTTEADEVNRARRRRRTTLWISGLVVIWAAVMLNRHPLRAWYYAHRLVGAQDAATHRYYFSRLCAMGDAAVGAAGRLLANEDAGIRSMGVAVLHQGRSDRARELLLEALGDPDEEVRRLAVLGLALFHDVRAVKSLVRMLSEPSEYPAVEAAVALERIGGDEAVAALVRAAKDHPVLNVRAQAIDSLGRLEARPAIDTLIELLADETVVDFAPASDRAARRALQQASRELAKQGMVVGAASSQPSGPGTVADLAARSLRRITKESFDFRSTDPPERRKNAIGLWKLWARGRHAT